MVLAAEICAQLKQADDAQQTGPLQPSAELPQICIIAAQSSPTVSCYIITLDLGPKAPGQMPIWKRRDSDGSW